MARKSSKNHSPIKTNLPYGTFEQVMNAIGRFEIGTDAAFRFGEDLFEIWVDQDADGKDFAVIFNIYDGSGNDYDPMFADEARELGWIA